MILVVMLGITLVVLGVMVVVLGVARMLLARSSLAEHRKRLVMIALVMLCGVVLLLMAGTMRL